MHRLAALLLAVALATTGCTGDGADPDPVASTSAGPVLVPAGPSAPFPAATAALPDGYSRVQCSDLRRPARNTELAVRFVVPPGYAAYGDDDGSCDVGGRGGVEVYVSFGPHSTLESEKRRDVDPYEGAGGDDSVSDISYAADVPVFGDHTGERLAYYCYCDGQELDYQVVQARGVRLTWVTPHGRQARSRAAYDAVRSGMALVRSDRSTCRSRGRTATFRPPVPQTESIDFPEDRCHLYLQPGRASLERYAEVELSPPVTLAARAERLRHRKDVVRVRYEAGVDVLDGRAADRLTWTVVRTAPGPNHEPTGTWRAVALGTSDVRVTWTARPRQWRTESDDARRFYDSVTVRRPSTTASSGRRPRP